MTSCLKHNKHTVGVKMSFQLEAGEAVAMNQLLSGFEAEIAKGYNVELECRIGMHDNYSFKPGVSEQTFKRLLDFHEGHCEMSYMEFQRSVFPNGCRMDVFPATQFENQHVRFCNKNTIDQVDLREYGLRMATAFEQPLPESFASQGVPQIVRSIIRYSYRLSECLRLDMSVVTSKSGRFDDNGPVERTFEVELEWILPSVSSASGLPHNWKHLFTYACEKLVSYVQNAFFLYKVSELSTIKRTLVTKMATRRIGHCFGAQPRTIQADDLSMVFWKRYAVGDKTDGVRAYVIIAPNGIFLMYRDINEPDGVRIFCIGRPDSAKTPLADLAWTLIEGEFSDEFVAFDLLIYRGNDLRGDARWHLDRRLDATEDAVRAINEHGQCKVSLKNLFIIKAGDHDGWQRETRRLLDVDFPPEGLVFTPVDECYPMGPNIENPHRSRIWSTLLKWKPVESLTIDFRVVAQGPDPGLYVLLKGTEIPFRPGEFQNAYMWENIVPGAVELKHGSIVEFRLTLENGRLQFHPVRQRLDKETPNAMHVCLDNLHAILNPVTYEMITFQTPPPPPDLSDILAAPKPKRVDKCWLTIQEFVTYTNATLDNTDMSDSQFPNVIQPMCIPVAVPPISGSQGNDENSDGGQNAPMQTVKRLYFSEDEFMKLKVEELRHIARMYQISPRGLRDELRQRLRDEGAVREGAEPSGIQEEYEP